MRFRTLALTVVLALAPLAGARAQCTQDALARFAPLDAYGFPRYYVDQAGVGMDFCDNPNDPLCGALLGANLAAPLDPKTGNFFTEAPYSFVTATMTLPTGGQALMVLSVLGTWGNPLGLVIDGTQTVFSRIRFRIDTPQGGLYTVTYPFGTATFNVARGGRRTINFTDDCINDGTCGQGIGRFFDTPLDPTLSLLPNGSHVSRFLVWDPSVAPAAPAGYAGDPAVLHTVVGSPCGQNVFRIEGPGLPSGGVQTDLFSVTGKLTVFCGNGILDPGEDCDDGNTRDGDCCSSTCTFEPAGSACDDGNACTTNETCDGAGTCAGVAGPPPVCPKVTIDADVSVDGGSPKSKLGSSKTLLVDAKPDRQTFIRTLVSGLGAHTASAAQLHLFVTTASKQSGGRLHVLPDCGWSESTMTYKTKPAITTPAFATIGPVKAKQTVDVDLGAALNHGDGLYCFALDSTSSAGAAYGSREAKTGKPSVSVTGVDGCVCVP